MFIYKGQTQAATRLCFRNMETVTRFPTDLFLLQLFSGATAEMKNLNTSVTNTHISELIYVFEQKQHKKTHKSHVIRV